MHYQDNAPDVTGKVLNALVKKFHLLAFVKQPEFRAFGEVNFGVLLLLPAAVLPVATPLQPDSYT